MKHGLRILGFFLGMGVLRGVWAQPTDWIERPSLAKAQQYLLELRIPEAEALLRAEDSTHNALPTLLKARALFFKHYVESEHSTLGADAQRFERLLESLNVDHAAGQPERLAAIAELHLMRAFIQLRSGDQWGAAKDGFRAYQRISTLRERYPQHPLGRFAQGLISATAGSLPKDYAWITRLVGIEGHVGEGMTQMKSALDHPGLRSDPVFGTELAYMYLLIRYHLLDDAKGSLADYGCDPSSSSFLLYLEAQLLMASGQNDRAIDLLTLRPRGPDRVAYPLMDLITGKALLNKLDPRASSWFVRYLNASKSVDRPYAALRYLWWEAQLNGHGERAALYADNMRKMLPKSEADRQAEVDFKAGFNPVLVRSRLLFDGGYYRDALYELSNQSPDRCCATEREKQEYRYRYGHILFKLGRWDEAEVLLRAASLCDEATYHCAASHLYFAEVLAHNGKRDEALKHYRMAQDLKGYPFAEGVQRSAKAKAQSLP
ncbi:hypothetical protein GC167_01875 [bacterium]|nr:hypothetical protein [bacterium]